MALSCFSTMQENSVNEEKEGKLTLGKQWCLGIHGNETESGGRGDTRVPGGSGEWWSIMATEEKPLTSLGVVQSKRSTHGRSSIKWQPAMQAQRVDMAGLSPDIRNRWISIWRVSLLAFRWTLMSKSNLGGERSSTSAMRLSALANSQRSLVQKAPKSWQTGAGNRNKKELGFHHDEAKAYRPSLH